MQQQNANKSGFTWYFTTITLSVFIALGSFLVLSIVGWFIFGESLSGLADMQMNLSDAKNISYLKYLQALQSICIFIVPCVFIAMFRMKRDRENSFFVEQSSPFSGKLLNYLQLNKMPQWQLIVLAVCIIVFAAPIINFSAEINSRASLPEFFSGIERWMHEKEKENGEIIGLLLGGEAYYHLFINLFVIAILPAISEEMVFRGLLQNFFVKTTGNSHIGIFISAFLFSALHMQFITFLPRLLLGLYLGYIFYWTKNLWFPIIAHFINNAVIVILLFFVKDISLENEFETIGTQGNMVWTIGVSVVVVVYLMWVFYKQRKPVVDKPLMR